MTTQELMEMSTTTMEMNPSRIESFANRLLQTLNQGTLALMISIGHRTGLFDALAEMRPAESAEIAATADLDERYVREWLGAMVTGRIVEYDAETRRYWLPEEHAVSLTRSSPTGNMAVFAQYVAVLGSVEDRIVTCFREGGGVPYSAFTRFHAVMAEDSGQSVLPALLDGILPIVPGLRKRLEEGIDVLDVGCGSGRALVLLAREFPNSRFFGYDAAAEAIAAGRREARGARLTNLSFEVRDVTNPIEIRSFDLITAFDAIHDQRDPARVLRRIHAALRDDGVFLMQDIDTSSELHRNMDHPLGPMLYTISTMHCMTVSLADDGAGLGTCWGVETAHQMLADAGFGSVRVERLAHDIQNAFFVVQK